MAEIKILGRASGTAAVVVVPVTFHVLESVYRAVSDRHAKEPYRDVLASLAREALPPDSIVPMELPVERRLDPSSLSRRARNVLRDRDIVTVEKLLSFRNFEILEWNAGQKTRDEILGLKLKYESGELE